MAKPGVDTLANSYKKVIARNKVVEEQNMTYEKKVPLRGAVIAKTDLINLIKILVDYFPQVKTSIGFKDNTTLSSLSCEELESLDFQNKHIASLEINGHVFSKEGNSHIRLDALWENDYKIQLEFDSYEKYLKISAEIDKWVVSVSCRKNYINFLHSWTSCVIYFIFFAISLSILAVKVGLQSGIVLFSTLLPAGIVALVFPIIKYAFPLTEIDIGINPSKKFRKIAWAIISILIIPVIISIVL